MTPLKSATGAFIMSVAYGHDILPNSSDPYVDLARAAMESFGAAANPGSFYVDIFPSSMSCQYFVLFAFVVNVSIFAVIYIPKWMMPSWAFKKKASIWRPYVIDFKEKPYAMVRERMVGRSLRR
jgi:hypothetical protein